MIERIDVMPDGQAAGNNITEWRLQRLEEGQAEIHEDIKAMRLDLADIQKCLARMDPLQKLFWGAVGGVFTALAVGAALAAAVAAQ